MFVLTVAMSLAISQPTENYPAVTGCIALADYVEEQIEPAVAAGHLTPEYAVVVRERYQRMRSAAETVQQTALANQPLSSEDQARVQAEMDATVRGVPQELFSAFIETCFVRLAPEEWPFPEPTAS